MFHEIMVYIYVYEKLFLAKYWTPAGKEYGVNWDRIVSYTSNHPHNLEIQARHLRALNFKLRAHGSVRTQPQVLNLGYNTPRF